MRPARPIGHPGPPPVAPLAVPALAAAAAALCLGPLAGAAAAAPREEAKVSVQIKDFSFAEVSEVAVGDTVTWVNKGAKPHLATTTKAPVAFASPELAAGESWSYTFTKPGTYAYVCKLHPDMKATVVAAPLTKAKKADATTVAAAAAKPAVAATPSAAPAEVEIEATAAEVDTEAGRSAAIMAGSLAVVLFLGLVTAAWPGVRQK